MIKQVYRQDHLAFRTNNRKKAVKFFCDAVGYREATEFEIKFDENDTALCSVLEPLDRIDNSLLLPWTTMVNFGNIDQRYVLAPEIFISEGSPGSIVDRWVKEHGSNLHHIALQVPEESTVEEEMQKWLENGWCEEFTSDKPFHCENMSQVFTKPSDIVGVIFELIKRKEAGFCQKSILGLMKSTESFLKADYPDNKGIEIKN